MSRDFETKREQVFTLKEVVRAGAEWPVVFGGFQRRGYLAADGAERMVLSYDFNDPAYIGPDPTSIVDVEFEYVWQRFQSGNVVGSTDGEACHANCPA